MSEALISVEDAARSFPEMLAQARNGQTSFIITENGRAVARLSPANRPAETCAELAARIAAQPQISIDNADDWERELSAARAGLKVPRSKWD